MNHEFLGSVRDRLVVLTRNQARRPVAGGIVVNRAAQVALVYSTYSGQRWHFPQGGIDEGETSVVAALKETAEEAGVEVRVVDIPPLDPGPGSTFVEPLAFGSPRVQSGAVHNPRCDYFGQWFDISRGEHASPLISQGAFDLLHQAARDAGINDEEFLSRRYELFDAFRSLPVCWQQHPVHHVFAFVRRAPERLNGESQQVRWWSLDQLSTADKGSIQLGRAVARLLPALGEIVEVARKQAEDDR